MTSPKKAKLATACSRAEALRHSARQAGDKTLEKTGKNCSDTEQFSRVMLRDVGIDHNAGAS